MMEGWQSILPTPSWAQHGGKPSLTLDSMLQRPYAVVHAGSGLYAEQNGKVTGGLLKRKILHAAEATYSQVIRGFLP